MARKKYRLVKVLAWIVGSLISLVLLFTLVFYLGRNFFMGKAVAYLNEKQPGEVQMEKMKLIPFINFPDITLQLESVSLYERPNIPDSSAQTPIVSLNRIHVTMDVVDLIRGDIMISEAKMEQGWIRLEVYEDSVSNLEYALGIRMGEDKEADTTLAPAINIDLDAIEISDVGIELDNHVKSEHFRLKVHKLESSFSYLSELINAELELEIEINQVKYLSFNEQGSRNVGLSGSIHMNPLAKTIEVKPSRLSVSGLDFETWGTYNYQGIPSLDFTYRAKNEGLEVLNFLFRGVLDLEEIEQIGSGTMRLDGDVKGRLGEELPVIRLNGEADELAFKIKSLNKEVSGISFQVFATNGDKVDMSKSYMHLTGFKARFPEGNITANATVRNIKSPELNVEVDGRVNLEGMEKMLSTDLISDLKGKVRLQGSVSGRVDRNKGEFLNDEGKLTAYLDEVGFVLNRDSVTRDSINKLEGEVFLSENSLGAHRLNLDYNGNQIQLSAMTDNLLLYLLDFDKDVKAELAISTDTLKLASLFQDSTTSLLLGEELHGLHFGASATVSSADLDEFLKEDSIPQVQLTLDSFGIQFPLMADISDMNASLTFGPDSISLHQLDGTIGESQFNFSGLLANYGILSQKDSTGLLKLDFALESEQMRAEDIFTFKNEFLLPETYSTEYLEDFRLYGSLDLPAEGLLLDSVPLDFNLEVKDLAWNFRYYPLAFEHFLVQLRKSGDQLFIDALEGKVGESNLKMTASIDNFTDSLENMHGKLVLESDLLDFNALLNYQMPETQDSVQNDSLELRESPRLDQVAYPNFQFIVDIEEMRYGDFQIYGMNGSLRSTREKIFLLDSFLISSVGGGSLELNGHFNVSNADRYLVGAEIELKDMNIDDIGLELQSGEETFVLSETFKGVLSAEGLVEVFVSPDFKVDISTTTAMFNVTVNDGELINFTPLQAAGKFLDNKNLDHVIFATLNNSFTLMDSKIIIPRMKVESSIGLMMIEGEQGLDQSFLYLLRVPTELAKQAAKSVMSADDGTVESNEVQRMQRGDFLRITVWSNGTESDFKLGDKRDKFGE